LPPKFPQPWEKISPLLQGVNNAIDLAKVLNTSMTQPTQPPDPRAPQTLKPKPTTGEKTLLYKKCSDG